MSVVPVGLPGHVARLHDGDRTRLQREDAARPAQRASGRCIGRRPFLPLTQRTGSSRGSRCIRIVPCERAPLATRTGASLPYRYAQRGERRWPSCDPRRPSLACSAQANSPPLQLRLREALLMPRHATPCSAVQRRAVLFPRSPSRWTVCRRANRGSNNAGKATEPPGSSRPGNSSDASLSVCGEGRYDAHEPRLLH